MKFCINCGTQLEDEENFCSNCGTRNLSDEVQSTLSDASAEASESLMEAETAPEEVAPEQVVPNTVEPVVQAPQMELPQEKKEKKVKKPKDPNKKSKKVPIIIGSIAAVIVIALIVMAVLTFPFKASIKTQKFETKSNVLTKTFELKSNQLVKDVYYSLNPQDPSNMNEYIKVEDFEGSFSVSVELKDLQVAPGKGKIYFVLDTIFSESDPIYVDYEYNMGYYAQVDPAKVHNIDEGLGKVTNRLIVKVKEGTSEDAIEKMAKNHKGLLVGMNYFTKEAQIEFSEDATDYNYDMDDLFEDIRKEDIVKEVNYEYVFKTTLDPVEDDEDEDGDGEENSNEYRREFEQPTTPGETEAPSTTKWTTPAPTTTPADSATTTPASTTTPADDETTTPSDDETTTSDEETTVDEETTTSDEVTTVDEETTDEETTEEVTPEDRTTGAIREPETTTTEEDIEEDIEDPYQGHDYDWNLEVINAPKAWKFAMDTAPVKVGVLDSFADYKHSDLNMSADGMKLLNGQSASEFYDFFSNNKDTHWHNMWTSCDFCNYLNHGTHVIGTIGSTINNQNYSNGVCNNCDILFANQWTYEMNDDELVRYSSQYGFAYDMCSLVLSGSKVINYSVGAQTSSTGFDIDEYAVNYMDSIFKQLEDDGYDFVFVKAAGNAGMSAESDMFVTYLKAGECSSKHTIVVGSIQNSVTAQGMSGELCYNLSGFSNYGALVDIAAPGSSIYSTYSFDEYGYMSGTSMAAPHVTGVIALVYDVNPNLTSEQVIDIVKNCVSKYAVKNSKLYPIVDAELAVRKAIELKAQSSDQTIEAAELENVGFLSGHVIDGYTSENISNVTLNLVSEAGKNYFANTNENGEYDITLPIGTYSMHVLSNNYIYETLDGIVVTENATTYNAQVALAANSQEEGIVEGSVINAFDASTVTNTLLEFRRGIYNTTGDIIYRCITDEDGNFKVELAPGNYTVEATVLGYQSNYFVITVIGGETVYNEDGTLTPVLENGEMRVVLTWGEYPQDLDSHLFGPTPSGRQFHTYYIDMEHEDDDEMIARLDVDDKYSYGPETTSVYVPVDGKYVFTVFDYTNRSTSSSTELARSGATVTLYMDDESYTFYVPNQEGNYWQVFYIEDGEVHRINNMGYSYYYDDLNKFEQN